MVTKQGSKHGLLRMIKLTCVQIVLSISTIQNFSPSIRYATSLLTKEEVIGNNSSSFMEKRQGNQRVLKDPIIQKLRKNTNHQNATSLH